MESARIQDLHKEWQSAVRAHENLFREGRMRGLTNSEIDELAPPYVLRIDAAYAQLKQAEAQELEGAASRRAIWKTPADVSHSAPGASG